MSASRRGGEWQTMQNIERTYSHFLSQNIGNATERTEKNRKVISITAPAIINSLKCLMKKYANTPIATIFASQTIERSSRISFTSSAVQVFAESIVSVPQLDLDFFASLP